MATKAIGGDRREARERAVAETPVSLDDRLNLAQHRKGSANGDVERLAKALGWFSLGLGLVQLAAPRRVARLVGVAGNGESNALIRAIGLREIASGVGILTQSRPTGWLWARVGGDALDLALLGRAMTSSRADRGRVAAATAAVLGVTAADALTTAKLGAGEGAPEMRALQAEPAHDVRATAAITINAPIEQIYQSWEGFQRLPRFMESLATVELTGERQSRWTANLPAGMSVGWDVEITDATPNERIAWRTVAGPGPSASGEVRFRPAPADQGTELLFDARFSPPGGDLGLKVGEMLADAAGTKIGNDLRRFKQLAEIGEVVLSDDSVMKGPNPARPS